MPQDSSTWDRNRFCTCFYATPQNKTMTQGNSSPRLCKFGRLGPPIQPCSWAFRQIATVQRYLRFSDKAKLRSTWTDNDWVPLLLRTQLHEYAIHIHPTLPFFPPNYRASTATIKTGNGSFLGKKQRYLADSSGGKENKVPNQAESRPKACGPEGRNGAKRPKGGWKADLHVAGAAAAAATDLVLWFVGQSGGVGWGRSRGIS